MKTTKKWLIPLLAAVVIIAIVVVLLTVFVFPKDEHTHIYESAVTKEATCTEDGVMTYTCTECGDTYTEAIPATGHTYEAVVTDPTCEVDGYTTYTCTVCGDSYVGDYTFGIGHVFITTVTDPTCTEDGYTTDTCIWCGESFTETIPATGHSYVETVTEPTCTAGGYTVHTCDACGDSSYVDNYVDALGHDYVLTDHKDATDTSNGYNVYTCTRCGDSYTDEIAARGHSYNSGVVTKAATCTENGVMTYTCSSCGATYTTTIPATGHTAGTAVIENEIAATCTQDGSYDSVTYCTVCNEELTRTPITIPATGHDYGDPTFTWSADYSTATATFNCVNCQDAQTVDAMVASQTTAATCTADGQTVYTATAAFNGQTYTDTKTVTIPATGHSWDSGTVTKEATCTEDGVMTYTCGTCGATYTEEIPATGHDYGDPTFTWSADYSTATATFNCVNCQDAQTVDAMVASQTTAATCTADGQTVYTATVTFNGQTYTDTKTVTIPATGHSWDSGVVTKEATCTEDGVMTYTCGTCGATYTEEIPATGHDYGDPTFTWSADYSTATATFTCANCQDAPTVDATVASQTTAATCTADGQTVYTATVTFNNQIYTDTQTVTISATEHSYEATVTAPTCTEQGYTTYTCSVCNYSYKDNYTDATGHTDADNDGQCNTCGEWLYTFSANTDGTYTITGYTGGNTEIIIPSTYNGASVTAIAAFAFNNNINITSVTIPDSVTSIGDFVFNNCTNLETVTIGDGVESIGDYAFYNCINLTSVTIPDSVTSIGQLAFSGTNLPSVTFASTEIWYVTNSSDYSGGAKLDASDLAVEDTAATYLRDTYSDFYWYRKEASAGLQYEELSDGAYAVTGIGSCADTALVLPSTYNGASVTAIGVSAFRGNTDITRVTIPDSVTSIGDYAFSDCYNLTNVTIGDGVTSIGDYAFNSCYVLRSIDIPDSVTSIGNYAFYSCDNLETVTIGHGVTSIGDYAFNSCYKLETVAIGDSATSIGASAFLYCFSLARVTFADTGRWNITHSSDYTGGAKLDASDLADDYTAADYLRDTYSGYYWYKE